MREQVKNVNFILLFGAAIVAAGLVYALPRAISPQPPSPPTATPSPTPTSPVQPHSLSTSTIIYGLWRGGQSEIRAVNADGTNDSALVFLPSDVKDVHVFSENQLLYIAETDQRDHGTKIEIYNLSEGTTQTVAEANSGWGIDDVVVSPDKTWMAWWEVKFAPGADVLLGGNSRVYTQPVEGAAGKTLIADEQATTTTPLRYPLFFDSQNRLYLDGFIPNGGGWNLGLWRTPAHRANLSALTGMEQGQYSSDPVVSSDGGTIAFTGYDPGTPLQVQGTVMGLTRSTILNSNLLQTLDLNNGQKTTLLGSVNNAQYNPPLWSDQEVKIVFSEFRLTGPTSSRFEGIKILDLVNHTIVSTPPLTKAQSFLLNLRTKELIWGTMSAQISEPGNLGDTYGPVLSSISALDLASEEEKTLASGIGLQFINAVPKQPGTFLGITVSPQAAKQDNWRSLQLKSFPMETIKPLAKTREPQQNLPKCADLLLEMFGTRKRTDLTSEQAAEWALIVRSRKCYDSPLYLYPEKDAWVEIKVDPPVQVIASQPNYKNGWLVWANQSGQLTSVKGDTFARIDYAYFAPDVTPPQGGLVATSDNLSPTLTTYAQKLGLQGQEIKDFVSFWQETLPPAPYYLVSHFHPEKARQIMPLTIDPKPDTLVQAVMYFQPLQDPVKINPPVFNPPSPREGFVAVDWSGIIDY